MKIDFPPASHRDDPLTSVEAEEGHAKRRETHCQLVLAAVRANPGVIARELVAKEILPGSQLARAKAEIKAEIKREKIFMGEWDYRAGGLITGLTRALAILSKVDDAESLIEMRRRLSDLHNENLIKREGSRKFAKGCRAESCWWETERAGE